MKKHIKTLWVNQISFKQHLVEDSRQDLPKVLNQQADMAGEFFYYIDLKHVYNNYHKRIDYDIQIELLDDIFEKVLITVSTKIPMDNDYVVDSIELYLSEVMDV